MNSDGPGQTAHLHNFFCFFLAGRGGVGGGVGGGRRAGCGVYCPFKNISLISSQSFIKGGRKPENQGKNHLTIRKQNLSFPHVT